VRIVIAAVGRLKSGPEIELVRDYVARANAAGKQLALTPIEHVEVEGRPPGDMRREATALLAATPEKSKTILLDERGENWSSRQLAESFAKWRDDGVNCVVFWIGGADGSAQGLKDQADIKIAFGRQTWPHKLVRAMISEQVYRAIMILGSTPYHRD
jgi:23S rRNA (pseudouridine1915-N3)-methyltransferase